MCLTGKQAVAWIQTFLEPVCRKGEKVLALSVPVKRVSWDPAEMGKPWKEIKKNPFRMRWRRISGQQSEKICCFQCYIIQKKWLVVPLCNYCFFFQENKSYGAQPFALILCQYVADRANWHDDPLMIGRRKWSGNGDPVMTGCGGPCGITVLLKFVPYSLIGEIVTPAILSSFNPFLYVTPQNLFQMTAVPINLSNVSYILTL